MNCNELRIEAFRTMHPDSSNILYPAVVAIMERKFLNSQFENACSLVTEIDQKGLTRFIIESVNKATDLRKSAMHNQTCKMQ